MAGSGCKVFWMKYDPKRVEISSKTRQGVTLHIRPKPDITLPDEIKWKPALIYFMMGLVAKMGYVLKNSVTFAVNFKHIYYD